LDGGERCDPMRPSKRRPAGEQVRETLTTTERAALEMLDRAGGVLDRWPVGRTVGLALARDRLVVVASDFTLLTEDGRRALHDARRAAAGTDEPGEEAGKRRDGIGDPTASRKEVTLMRKLSRHSLSAALMGLVMALFSFGTLSPDGWMW
jgi:hypothetical protein